VRPAREALMTGHFTDHFGEVAGDYARFRPRYPPALFEWLATRCARTGLAWDCACGSGQATGPLAAHFTRVVGTDASPSQLAHAPHLSNVEWRCAPAERSGLADATVDLVTVAQALHWLPLAAFHAEVARVLRPGGVFATVSYGSMCIDLPALDALVQHYHDVVVGPWWPPERRHVVDGYRHLPFPYAQLPVPAFAMAVRWSPAELLGYLRSWSASAACHAARGRDPVEAFAHELAACWPRERATIEVRWPMRIRVGHKPH
jgi:SAM-dependent methyltransferase